MSDDLPPSRTRLKKQMAELQELGAKLTRLDSGQLAAMALPDPLRDAVLAAQRMTRFEARRRQLQYIGRLMRHVDPGPIRAHLERWTTSSREHTARLHHLERWRDRLLADDAALTELAREHPCDLQRLRTLVRNARRERETNAPPRSYRALFQALTEIVNGK